MDYINNNKKSTIFLEKENYNKTLRQKTKNYDKSYTL